MEFIKENYINISILSILIFTSLILFSIYKDRFSAVPSYVSDNLNNQNKPKFTLVKQLDVETFENRSLVSDTKTELIDLPGAFCKKLKPKPHLLKSHCKNLGIKGCHIPSCCVLINSKNCVPGDHNGPTFRTENRKDVLVDYFEYNGKCKDVNGKCPK